MSQDPYPSNRPDPHGEGPYSEDPYVPNRPDQPAYGPPPAAPPPGPGQPPGPGHLPSHVPPPYLYPAPPPPNSSAIVLTVVSGFLTLTGLCCYISIIPLVFGILGLTKQASDPEGAKQMTKYGWISMAIITVVVVLGFAAFIALAIAAES